MRFIQGKTRCVRCGRLLDTTDDWVVVSLVYESTYLDSVGFYHRECFDALPNRDALIQNWEKYVRAQPVYPRSTWKLVADSDDYRATFIPADKRLVLYLFRKFAELDFLDEAQWREFRMLLLEPSSPASDLHSDEITLDSQEQRYRLVISRNQERVTLYVRSFVQKEISLELNDYRDLIASRDVNTPGELSGFVDFGKALSTLRLRPRFVDGSLDRCTGWIVRVRPIKDYMVVVFDAPRWLKLDFTYAEFHRLRSFLNGVSL